MKVLNRCHRARESAGLSASQVARRLGMSVDQICQIEGDDTAYAAADQAQLANLYGVNLDWLSGRSELRDYAAVKQLSGADGLSFSDRDSLAELFASRPKQVSR